jgi:hypothetical protein
MTIAIKGKRRARSTSVTGHHGRRPWHLQRPKQRTKRPSLSTRELAITFNRELPSGTCRSPLEFKGGVSAHGGLNVAGDAISITSVFDGMPHPIVGSPNTDAAAATQIDAYTQTSAPKRLLGVA